MADVIPRPDLTPPAPLPYEGRGAPAPSTMATPPIFAGKGAGWVGSSLGRQALGVLTLLAILALWEGLSRARVLNPQFFPPVTDILATFVGLWQNNIFPGHLATTLWRMAVGYAIAAVLGIGL